jgi:hypothetical protein
MHLCCGRGGVVARTGENSEKELLPFEFVDALLRCAAKKYGKEAGSLAAKLKLLVQEHLSGVMVAPK